MGKCKKILIGSAAAAAGFVGVTFTVYFFNLDMKLTAAMEPLMLKWYDHLEKDTFI
ncbi:MAG: hypothetical protein PUD55_01135 [Firmicutes bacterium]|nr:hypothetical protein [Bacillota bacterium]